MLNLSINHHDFVFDFLCVLFIINTLKSLFFNQIDMVSLGYNEIIEPYSPLILYLNHGYIQILIIFKFAIF